jgi:putative DNA primase/helicase
VLSRGTPHKSAEAFREKMHPTLINVAEDWLVYRDNIGAYELIDNKVMRSQIQRFMIAAKCIVMVKDDDDNVQEQVVPFNPKKNDVTEVYEALFNACLKPLADFKPPCWLTNEYTLDPRNIIACRNGLLDVTTRELYSHTADFFTRSALPVEYNADAPAPVQFLKFLGEITDNRQSLIDLIQEMIGYYLSADTEQEVVFYLLGKSRGGKGTLMKIIAALIGERNLAAPTIRSFASQYWAWGLMDKSLAMVTDMAISDREAIKLAANHINMISGRDPADVERKFKEPIMALTLPTRVLMAGNHLPDFGDHAGALMNRLLVIPFDVSFKGREDRALARRMIADELSSILTWALEGLARLRERGNFCEPVESKRVKRDLMGLANPVATFIEEKCLVGPEHHVRKDVLYAHYKDWASTVGVHPLALKDFAQRLYSGFPGIKEVRPRDGEKRIPAFGGVTVNPDADDRVTTVPSFDFEFELMSRIELEGMTPADALAATCEAQAEFGRGVDSEDL